MGHAWFKTGSRSRVKVKLGFKNFYLYSAVNPKTGAEFTLLLPRVNKELMKIFIDEFYKKYRDKNVILIMDGAGWHKDSTYLLKDVNNIEIILQPPYSPELNPVERLWQYIKDRTIKNEVYETLEELEDELCKFIKVNITSEVIKRVCNCEVINGQL